LNITASGNQSHYYITERSRPIQEVNCWLSKWG